MNIYKLVIGLLLIPTFSFCQIPNHSFESWTDSVPDNWITNSSPPSLLPVLPSTDAHTGNFSLQCQIVDDSGFPFGPYIQPASGSYGFPYNDNDSILYGFYKSNLIGSNLGLVEVIVYDSLLLPIGAGISFLSSSTNFTEFTVPIIYLPGAIASEMTIIIQMSDTDSTSIFNVGSYFLIDDLSFTHTSSVNIQTPDENYYSVSPNPATDFMTIHADLSMRRKQYYAIYDVTGKKILSDHLIAINDDSTSAIDVSSLPTGNYLMVITDGENSATKKIIINR